MPDPKFCNPRFDIRARWAVASQNQTRLGMLFKQFRKGSDHHHMALFVSNPSNAEEDRIIGQRRCLVRKEPIGQTAMDDLHLVPLAGWDFTQELRPRVVADCHHGGRGLRLLGQMQQTAGVRLRTAPVHCEGIVRPAKHFEQIRDFGRVRPEMRVQMINRIIFQPKPELARMSKIN